MQKKKIRAVIYIIITILIQSALYLLAKTISGETHIIGSALDDYIYFNYIGIIPYVLWYLLLFIIPLYFYKKKKQLYVKYILCYLLTSLLADIVFTIYPSEVIRPELNGSGILHFITNLIYSIDTPAVNCFPSLHCAVACLWILLSLEEKKIKVPYKIIICIVSVLIMISTLVIKQHVLVDVSGGIAIAIISYLIIANNVNFVFKVRKKIKLE